LLPHEAGPQVFGAQQDDPDVDAHGVVEKGSGVSRLRALMSRWFYAGVIAKPTATEIAEVDHHADGHELEGSDVDGHELTGSRESSQASH